MAGLTSTVAVILAMATTGGIGLPFGVPPGPEDPVIARVAPEECLFYLGWEGTASPNPKTPNQTEQLLAEPEVQNFLTQLDRAIWQTIEKSAKGGENPDADAFVKELVHGTRLAATRPGCAFVSKVKFKTEPGKNKPGQKDQPQQAGPKGKDTLKPNEVPAKPGSAEGGARPADGKCPERPVAEPTFTASAEPNSIQGRIGQFKQATKQSPIIEGAVVLSLGSDAARLKTAMEKYIQSSRQEEAKQKAEAKKAKPAGAAGRPAEDSSTDAVIEDFTIGGETWHRSPHDADSPCISFGFHGNYFILAMGDKTIEGILARMQAAPPKWWSAITEQLPIERRCVVTYINFDTLRDLIMSQCATDEMKNVRARVSLELLGLSNARALVEVWGLDGDNFANKTLLVLDGPPRGLLELISDRPLKPEDLRPIPRDATVAAAFRLDPQQVMDNVLQLIEKLDPKDRDEAKRKLDELERTLKIDLRHGTLKSMGDTWCVYNSPSENGFILSGWTAVVPLRDWAGMNLSYGRIMSLAKQWAPAPPPNQDGETDWPLAMTMAMGGSPRLEQFSFEGSDVYCLNMAMFAPSWCMTRQEMVFGLAPQNIKAYLARGDRHQPIDRLPAITKLFADGAAPSAIIYGDSPRMWEAFYSMMLMYGPVMSNTMRGEGIDVDLSLMPSAPSIGRHLGPTLATLRRTSHGIEFVSRGTIPLPSLTSWWELSLLSSDKNDGSPCPQSVSPLQSGPIGPPPAGPAPATGTPSGSYGSPTPGATGTIQGEPVKPAAPPKPGTALPRVPLPPGPTPLPTTAPPPSPAPKR